MSASKGKGTDSARRATTDPASPARPDSEPLRAAQRERDDAAASRDRFALLAEVSRCLADSLDYEATLTTVAGMSLPYLGSWCIVDVLEEDGRVRRLAVVHPDPAKQALARELFERYPPRADDLIGAPRVSQSGRRELVADLPDSALEASARDAEHLALLRGLGIRGFLIVPMIARRRMLGAITFVTDLDRRSGDLDVVMAEDLAHRAAMAIDNARLHRDAQSARRLAEAAATEAKAAAQEANLASEEARRARDEARTALATRGRFVSTMSHEFRTPINAIIGYAQLLDLGVAGTLTDRQRDFMARLTATSEHLRELVDDVLDVARLDADALKVSRAPGMTGALVATALDLVRPQADAKGIRLVDARAGEPGEPFVGDEHRVRQILANLLSNAVKFTDAGGTVTVACGRADTPPEPSLQRSGEWTFIRVTDTGIGIPAAEHERIFEPFHQVQERRARASGGTGLGLAISRRLARLMGGDLTVESSPGVGSTFTLWLPATTVAEVERATDIVPERGARARMEPGVTHGLAEVGTYLREEMEAVLAAYAARLRADPTFPQATHLRRSEVEDHQPSFIVDLAQTLVVVDETGGPESDVLRDGTTIQRVVAELHGAMRQRRGWTEAQLVREYAILGEELEAAVHRRVTEDAGDVALALEVIDRLLQRARAIALAALRRGTNGGAA